MEQAYKVNIDANVIDEQYRTEKQTLIPKSQVGFDAKHYLEARLGEGELTKTLVIRLLPFDSNGVYDYLSLGVPYGIRTHDPEFKRFVLSSLTEPTELREQIKYMLSLIRNIAYTV